MTIDWNGLVKDAESELARALTARVVSGIVGKFAVLGAFSGVLGFVIGLVIGQLVKYGDWLGYSLGNGWKNTQAGKDYERKGLELEELPKTATKEEVARAKKAKQDAFDQLFSSGRTP